MVQYIKLLYSVTETSLKVLEAHIQRTSILQILKSIAKVGVTKSIKYAWNKKLKAYKGK